MTCTSTLASSSARRFAILAWSRSARHAPGERRLQAGRAITGASRTASHRGSLQENVNDEKTGKITFLANYHKTGVCRSIPLRRDAPAPGLLPSSIGKLGLHVLWRVWKQEQAKASDSTKVPMAPMELLSLFSQAISRFVLGPC